MKLTRTQLKRIIRENLHEEDALPFSSRREDAPGGETKLSTLPPGDPKSKEDKGHVEEVKQEEWMKTGKGVVPINDGDTIPGVLYHDGARSRGNDQGKDASVGFVKLNHVPLLLDLSGEVIGFYVKDTLHWHEPSEGWGDYEADAENDQGSYS
jgi:hypothetical protein